MKETVYMILVQMATNSTRVSSTLHIRHCLLSAVTRQVMYIVFWKYPADYIYLAACFCVVYLSPVKKKKIMLETILGGTLNINIFLLSSVLCFKLFKLKLSSTFCFVLHLFKSVCS